MAEACTLRIPGRQERGFQHVCFLIVFFTCMLVLYSQFINGGYFVFALNNLTLNFIVSHTFPILLATLALFVSYSDPFGPLPSEDCADMSLLPFHFLSRFFYWRHKQYKYTPGTLSY